MFTHIIKIGDKYLVRKWRVIQFSYMVLRHDRTYWWGIWPEDWARFDTAEQARIAYQNRPIFKEPKRPRKKFIGFV